MTPDDNIRIADEIFFELFHDFNVFDHVNPVNSEEERTRFLELWRDRVTYNPQFQYSTIPSKIEKMKEGLLKLSFGQAPLDRCYESTRRELVDLCELCQARGTERFTLLGMRLFGEPTASLLAEATQTLKSNRPRRGEDEPELGVKSIVEKFRERLREDRIDGWDVVEDPKSVGLALVDSSDRKIRLQTGVLLSKRMVDRLLHHEIGVHVYRCVNGSRQPFKAFAVGFDGFAKTDEGLALILEERMGLATAEVKRRYAARVLASSWASKKSFFDIFSSLVEFFNPEEAFTLTQRSKRGIQDTSKPGGFIQDHIYLQGKKEVETLSKQDIQILYTGRISVHHIPVVRELMAQKRVLAPAFIPSVFHG